MKLFKKCRNTPLGKSLLVQLDVKSASAILQNKHSRTDVPSQTSSDVESNIRNELTGNKQPLFVVLNVKQARELGDFKCAVIHPADEVEFAQGTHFKVHLSDLSQAIQSFILKTQLFVTIELKLFVVE